MKVRRSAWVERPAEQMFDLIERAEHYHRFLPWCTGAVILERDDRVVAADLQVAFKGVRFQLRTRNPKTRPSHMAIHLERGPFRRFEGVWSLEPLGPAACKVQFGLDYEFDSAVLDRLAGRWFERATDTLVDAFVRQAMSEPLATPEGLAPVSPSAAAATASGTMPPQAVATDEQPSMGPAPPAAELPLRCAVR